MRNSLILKPWWLVLAAACSSGSPSDKPETETAPQALAQTAAGSTGLTDSTVKDDGTGPAALVNGQPVPRELFTREFDRSMERYERAKKPMQPGLRERVKNRIVERLIQNEIIRQQAEKNGVTLSQAESDQLWTAHRDRYGTDESFQAFLARADQTEQELRNQFEFNLIRNKLLVKVASSVTVSEEELKKYYEENIQRFTLPERVRARHILIRKPPRASEAALKKVKARAAKVLKEVRQKPKEFEALAAKYGEDAAKKRGGDLGWFGKGQRLAPLEKAVWSMDIGSISDLVESKDGYHIIRKDGHQQSRAQPFEEVKQAIQGSLEGRRRNNTVQETLKKWRAEADVKQLIRGDEAVIRAEAKQSAPPSKSSPNREPAPPANTGAPRQ